MKLIQQLLKSRVHKKRQTDRQAGYLYNVYTTTNTEGITIQKKKSKFTLAHTFGASTGVVPRKQNRERLV